MTDLLARQSIRNWQTAKHNLPAQLTKLIGRKREVAEVRSLLQRPEVRLVTLTGIGGVGKTRLGLHVATEVAEEFAEGAYFVSLAPISDPDLVVPTIAEVLGIRDIGDRILLDLLKAYLQNKPLLLLLDNFEQVLTAAVQVAELLSSCSRIKVVVTSRAVLHVRGEQEYSVPPLAVPDPKQIPDRVALSQYESVALFLQRAHAALPDFQLTEANATTIAKICMQLEGLPLAIELAAARIKLLPPQALLARLEHRLTVLTSGSRDVPARHQTLRNTIAWSYQLLDMPEQRLFRRLAVFVGGCTLEAVSVVCYDPEQENLSALDEIASLIDKSLLQQVSREGETERALRLAVALWWFWYARGHLSEGRRWIEQLLQNSVKVTGPLRAKALNDVGWFAYQQDDYSQAKKWLNEGLVISRQLGDAREIGVSLHRRSLVAWREEDYLALQTFSEEALTIFSTLGDKEGIADTLLLLSDTYYQRDDYANTYTMVEQAMALFKELGDQWAIAACLEQLAEIAVARGEPERAAQLWGAEEALEDKAKAMGYTIKSRFCGKKIAKRSEKAVSRLLGEQAFAAAWAQGRAMTPEQVLAAQESVVIPLASSSSGESSNVLAKPPPLLPDGLTAREVEVLRLVASGLTDAQVAERLVISPRTVNSHLTSIYSKIGISSRSAATRYGIEHHFV